MYKLYAGTVLLGTAALKANDDGILFGPLTPTGAYSAVKDLFQQHSNISCNMQARRARADELRVLESRIAELGLSVCDDLGRRLLSSKVSVTDISLWTGKESPKIVSVEMNK